MCYYCIIVTSGCPTHITFINGVIYDHHPVTITMYRSSWFYSAAWTYMYMLIIFFHIINDIPYPRWLSFRLVLLYPPLVFTAENFLTWIVACDMYLKMGWPVLYLHDQQYWTPFYVGWCLPSQLIHCWLSNLCVAVTGQLTDPCMCSILVILPGSC